VEIVDGPRLLIDTPQELRLQLVAAGIGTVDAVLYTHDHADHVSGIDDLRALSVRRGDVPVYGPPETIESLAARFSYIFDPGVEPQSGTCKPRLLPSAIEPYRAVEVGGASVLPVELDHGGTRVYGYRVGAVAYLTDAKSVPDAAIEALQGVELLVLNALFDEPHPTHLSVPEAIETAQRIGARRTFLTHLTHRHSYADLAARLPEGILPAYDGLVTEF
jgi:phosphoribosyl 1,2-cyclic phosphate phosphodiesterase